MAATADRGRLEKTRSRVERQPIEERKGNPDTQSLVRRCGPIVEARRPEGSYPEARSGLLGVPPCDKSNKRDEQSSNQRSHIAPPRCVQYAAASATDGLRMEYWRCS